MPSVGTASIDLTVDKNQVGRAISGGVQSNSGMFKGLGMGLAKTFFAGFAGYKAIGLFKDSIEEAREAAKVQRLTNQIIKTTGGSAKISAGGVEKLATELSNLAGIDDEVIQSAENVLLTFKAVKNETGAGNNIFDRATKAALDMNAVIGGDLTGNITAIGKAMQDPAKGAVALAKAGSLARTDLAKLKDMAAAGVPVLEQQKFILKALEEQYGGSAAAAADPMQRLSVMWGNIKEQLGGALLPVLSKVAEVLVNKLPGALEEASKWFSEAGDRVKDFVAGFTGNFDKIDENYGLFKIGAQVREFVNKYLVPAAKWLKTNWKTALVIAGAALLLFSGPIVAITAGLVILYAKFKWFRDFVGLAARYIVEQWGKFKAYFVEIFPQVQEAFVHFVNVVKAIWAVWGDDILKIVQAVWSQAQNLIKTAIGVIQNVIRLVLAVINGDWGKAWDAIKAIVGVVWDYIKTSVGNGIDFVTGLMGGIGDTIGSTWNAMWQGMADFVDGIWVGIQNSVRSGVNFVIDAINLLIRGYNKLPFHDNINEIKRLAEVSRPDAAQYKRIHESAGLASYDVGGWVPGPVGAPQLAIVHGGEYVVSNDELRAGGRSGGGGPMIGQLVVHANSPAEGQAAGRALIATIEQYRRNGGAMPAWWSQARVS